MIAEGAVKFIMPLQETSTVEHQVVTMECQLSRPDQKVTWLKNGQEITPDDTHEVSVDGTFHRLTLKDTVTDDEAEYTVTLGDDSTSAKLFVEGKSHSCICESPISTVRSFKWISPAEEPVYFTIPLQDKQCKEQEEVFLECEISKPDRKLQWFKDGQELLPVDARFEIQVEGCSHKLVFHETMVEDTGEYTVKIGDQTSTAKLDVEGENIHYLSLNGVFPGLVYITWHFTPNRDST